MNTSQGHMEATLTSVRDGCNLKLSILVDDSSLGGVNYRGTTGHIIEREEMKALRMTLWLLMA